MQEGFAEYPAFTKPQTWREIAVPEILLSGNHAQIAAWRAQSAKDRAEKNF
jgi:tRNA (guanine37-N1)-methyltransferase